MMNWKDYVSYSKWALKTSISNPVLFLRDLNRLYHRRLLLRNYNTGIDIFKEDWDNLIILDGCRFDVFQKYNTIPGNLEKKTSRGSHTVEFLHANFADKDLDDSVYITANPQYSRNADDLNCDIYAVYDVWAGDSWDKDIGTVTPDVMKNRTKNIAEKHPNKRLIIHFIQPHYPFIGSEDNFDKNILKEGEQVDIWTKVLFGELEFSKEDLWDLYVENLQLALPHVQDLVLDLVGKSVVTSDHGNMMGERAWPIPIKEWGHPIGLYTDNLIKIPWLVCEFEGRKDIISSEKKADFHENKSMKVEDRLEDLGYL